MPLIAPSALAFRNWPKFKPVIQLPAPSRSRALARRWKLHGGRMATALGAGALLVILLMGGLLAWPQVQRARAIVAAWPTSRPTATRPPATATRPPATATRPKPTATPPVSATPDLNATLSAAVAATLTAQPTRPPENTPQPTASAIPATPVFTVNQGPLVGVAGDLFDETFRPGGYWDIGETPYALREIKDGQLNLRIKNIGSISWSFNGISGDNFYVQAATTVDSCRSGDYYGLVFRVRDDSNFYMYGISCDGRYRVIRQENGEFTSLIEFTFSPNIISLGSYNLLGVRAVNNQFSFYVNDQLLDTTTDDTFTQGRFGVFAKSFETPDLTIHFDDITAWKLTP